MCEICFCKVGREDAAVDLDGVTWDIHSGDCARQAGIYEPEPKLEEHVCKYDEASETVQD
jgi:hypothetical protein